MSTVAVPLGIVAGVLLAIAAVVVIVRRSRSQSQSLDSADGLSRSGTFGNSVEFANPSYKGHHSNPHAVDYEMAERQSVDSAEYAATWNAHNAV
jgi:hypothetical protein